MRRRASASAGALAAALLLAGALLLPAAAARAFWPGTLIPKAAVVGLVLAEDPDTGCFTVYGRLSADEGEGYRVRETCKFYRVLPAHGEAAAALRSRIGSGAKAFGPFETAAGRHEEHLTAYRVTGYDPAADAAVGFPPAYGGERGPWNWTGFGVAERAQHVWKFDVCRPGDFVDALAEIRAALAPGPGEWVLSSPEAAALAARLLAPSSPEDREARARLAAAWRARWHDPWLLEKDGAAARECARAAGGSAFFLGKIGARNAYVESVPAIRPDLDRMMDSAPEGGGAAPEWGPAAAFGRVAAERDRGGRIVRLWISGPLFGTARELALAARDGPPAPQTWRLEGWDPGRAEVLDGKRCWVSGTRVPVYDDKGRLVDMYFALGSSLTRAELDSALHLAREIALRGGI